mgnify:FL=1
MLCSSKRPLLRTAMCQARTYLPVDRIRSIIMVVLIMCGGCVCAQDLSNIKDQKPVQFSGSATVQGGPYFYSGDEQPRNLPWFWNASCMTGKCCPAFRWVRNSAISARTSVHFIMSINSFEKMVQGATHTTNVLLFTLFDLSYFVL